MNYWQFKVTIKSITFLRELSYTYILGYNQKNMNRGSEKDKMKHIPNIENRGKHDIMKHDIMRHHKTWLEIMKHGMISSKPGKERSVIQRQDWIKA